MRAEREKRAVILQSEGERDAAINTAEGQKQQVIKASEAKKQQQINEAEGQASAILAVAKATAEGIRSVAQSIQAEGGFEAVQLRVAEQYVEQFGNIASAGNTLVVPANLADVASMIALAMNAIQGKGASPRPPAVPPGRERRSPSSACAPAERALVARLRTPYAVERWLRVLPYNFEQGGETLRSFRRVVRDHTAHCLEAALFAAAALEPHGYPALAHEPRVAGPARPRHLRLPGERPLRSGRPVARPRPARPQARVPDPALPGPELPRPLRGQDGPPRGLRPGRPARAGRLRLALRGENVWKVERWLIDYPHQKVRMPEGRYRKWHARYLRYIERYRHKPVYYEDKARWLWPPRPVPIEG